MKKLFCTLLAAGGLLALALPLTSCNAQAQKSTKEIYAYSAASAFRLADGLTAAQPMTDGTNDTDDATYQEYVDTVNTYMEIAENMLSGGDVLVQEIPTVQEYAFACKITLSGSDDASAYEMYYDKQMKPQDDPDEEEYDVVGIIRSGETEFSLVGEMEKEADECEMKLKICADEQNYVLVEHETEAGELEYSYSIYRNGRLSERTEFEHERSANEREIEFTVAKDGKSQRFEMQEKTRGNGKYIEGKVCDGDKNFRFEICTKQEGDECLYEYKFENGDVYRKNRHHGASASE